MLMENRPFESLEAGALQAVALEDEGGIILSGLGRGRCGVRRRRAGRDR